MKGLSGDISVFLYASFWEKCSDLYSSSLIYFPMVFILLFSPSKAVYFNSSIQFSSVTQSCPTLCHPMNHSMPGLCVHHQLPEFNQTHFHQVSDAIQPSHPLSSPAPPAPQSLPESKSFPMSQLFA